jgi:FtsH-binding integral membrane protein|tara:strand:+ start:1308 stop:1694 length:387 start_codon:yes stop_codon:yes gene_type:complete
MVVREIMRKNYMNIVQLVLWIVILMHTLRYAKEKNRQLMLWVSAGMILVFTLDIVLSSTNVIKTDELTDNEYNNLLIFMTVINIVLIILNIVITGDVTLSDRNILGLVCFNIGAALVIILGKKINTHS